MTNQSQTHASEDFPSLYEAYEKGSQQLIQGSVVKGVIIDIGEKSVEVDIGAKSSGFVSVGEFKRDGEINKGDVIDVFLQRLENRNGEVVISRENARKFLDWNYLKQCLSESLTIEGKIIGKVKGGYAVDYNSITCFLPKSQVDTVFLGDNDNFLIGKVEKLRVLKIDDLRGNIVVSRRAVLESKRSAERDQVLAKIKVGDALDGMVKNITDYGAFVDFGGFDGLLHLTDISWSRIKHPSELLKVGDTVKVQVIKYDEASKRVSLGMKQLQSNPWSTISERYKVGSVVKGKVTNITGYGAFVEIENGIEGLVHISEMSWLKKQNAPSKLLNVGQPVEVMILDIDPSSRRISLGMKQCENNPWREFAENHKVGDIVTGKIKNFTDFGLFVDLENGIDGLVHISDITSKGDAKSMLEQFERDKSIEVMVLGSNHERERISLGIKQLDNSGFKDQLEKIEAGMVVSCVVVAVKKDFIEVELDFGLKGTIKRLDLSKDKQNQNTERFEINDRIEAKITLFDPISGKLLLSVKDIESDASDTKSEDEPAEASEE